MEHLCLFFANALGADQGRAVASALYEQGLRPDLLQFMKASDLESLGVSKADTKTLISAAAVASSRPPSPPEVATGGPIPGDAPARHSAPNSSNSAGGPSGMSWARVVRRWADAEDTGPRRPPQPTRNNEHKSMVPTTRPVKPPSRRSATTIAAPNSRGVVRKRQSLSMIRQQEQTSRQLRQLREEYQVKKHTREQLRIAKNGLLQAIRTVSERLRALSGKPSRSRKPSAGRRAKPMECDPTAAAGTVADMDCSGVDEKKNDHASVHDVAVTISTSTSRAELLSERKRLYAEYEAAKLVYGVASAAAQQVGDSLTALTTGTELKAKRQKPSVALR